MGLQWEPTEEYRTLLAVEMGPVFQETKTDSLCISAKMVVNAQTSEHFLQEQIEFNIVRRDMIGLFFACTRKARRPHQGRRNWEGRG